jgi:hypothetical protein
MTRYVTHSASLSLHISLITAVGPWVQGKQTKMGVTCAELASTGSSTNWVTHFEIQARI